MASQGYDFNTALFNVKELGVIGSTSSGPIVKLRIGGALLRAVYEYRNSGIMAGALDVGPPARPSQLLLMMNAASRFSTIPSLTTEVAYPDPSGTVSYNYLSPDHDTGDVIVAYVDGTYTSGDVACPELKTWCEALGGVYTKGT